MECSLNRTPVREEEKMEDYLNGTWEEFENWIKGMIESNFSWRMHPVDSPLK